MESFGTACMLWLQRRQAMQTQAVGDKNRPDLPAPLDGIDDAKGCSSGLFVLDPSSKNISLAMGVLPPLLPLDTWAMSSIGLKLG